MGGKIFWLGWTPQPPQKIHKGNRLRNTSRHKDAQASREVFGSPEAPGNPRIQLKYLGRRIDPQLLPEHSSQTLYIYVVIQIDTNIYIHMALDRLSKIGSHDRWCSGHGHSATHHPPSPVDIQSHWNPWVEIPDTPRTPKDATYIERTTHRQ